MKLLRAFLWLNVSCLLVGCGEPAADVTRPRLYEKEGLAFQHPGNWKIEEDQSLEGIRHLTIETSGDALVIVQMFPPGMGLPLEDYARAFAKASAEELPMGRVVASKFTPLAKSDGFDSLQEDFKLQLLGEKVPHVRRYFSQDFGGRQCFIICQVAEEDLGMVEAGFKQVTTSLKVSPPPEAKVP
jgi:hypothetical protein